MAKFSPGVGIGVGPSTLYINLFLCLYAPPPSLFVLKKHLSRWLGQELSLYVDKQSSIICLRVGESTAVVEYEKLHQSNLMVFSEIDYMT